MGNRRQFIRKALAWLAWSYVIFLLVTWGMLYIGGDRWWFATVLLFAPRWICGMPLVVLVPTVLVVRRRLLWPLALSGALLVGPIMGLCVPWTRLVRREGPTVRVLTWNVRGDCADGQTLAALIDSVKPDIVALQECDEKVHLDWPAGWRACRQGRLVIGSPHPIRAAGFYLREIPPTPCRPVNGLRCMIEAPSMGSIGFVNVHLGTPREGLTAVLSRRTVISPSQSGVLADSIDFRQLESEALDRWIRRQADPAVIARDFNMPADGVIYRRIWSKHANAFSLAGLGFGHTKRTEVLGWQYGSRIDHILAGPGWRPIRAWVGRDLGSDHLPLIADLSWQRPCEDR